MKTLNLGIDNNTQLDIIKVELNESIKKDQYITIELNYTIKLPDSKFTGHGYDGKNFYLKNWLIVSQIYLKINGLNKVI